MGVDLLCIFEHKLSKKDLVNLPSIIDSWSSIRKERKSHYSNFPDSLKKQTKIDAFWDADIEITEKILEEIFESWKTNNSTYQHSLKNRIDCFLGFVKVYENSIIVEYSPEHKYANLHDKDISSQILKLNRLIANKLNSDKILYCPDSSFPTAQIYYKIQEGMTVDDAIEFGENKFQKPPEQINEGMKFMFFIDDLKKNIDSLEDWDWSDLIWQYNETTNQYELNNAT